MDAKAIKALLVKLKPGLLRKYPIASIGLFGSAVRNDFGPESDIDIIVDFHRPVGMEFIDLAYELEKSFHRRVDLVSARGVKRNTWQLFNLRSSMSKREPRLLLEGYTGKCS